MHVCVTGETSPMGRALDMILETVFSDPLSNSYPNVSYSDAQLMTSLGGGGSGSAAVCKLHTGIIPNNPAFAMLRNSLRVGGYVESAIEEIVAAVYTLASYGFLTFAEGSTNVATMLGMVAASGSQLYPGSTSDSTAAHYDATVGTSMPNLLTNANYAMNASGFADNSAANASGPYAQYQGFMNSGTYSQNAAYQYYGQAGYNPPDYSSPNIIPPPPPPPPPTTEPNQTQNTASTTTHSFEIGEHIVGALLGPGGRSIIDLQTWSGASVEVSKKGTYAPGTRNRIVTVTGNPMAVYSATYFIKQCIDQEEWRRASSVAAPGQQPPAEMPSQSWPPVCSTANCSTEPAESSHSNLVQLM